MTTFLKPKLVASLVALWAFSSLQAAADFYVDPDWGGAAEGSASRPWRKLDSAAWQVINASLANGSVVVYFSAREAASDSPESSTDGIILDRFDQGANRLTLDGKSKYNTNDAAPSWSSYAGSSRFRITAPKPIKSRSGKSDTGVRVRITVQGFILRGNGNGKCVSVTRASDLTFDDLDMSHTSSAANGPCFHIDPTVFSPSYYWSDHVTLKNSKVHDTYGEAIYVNGCKTAPCAGSATGSHIRFENVEVYNAGARGGQGDGIDLKDGLTSVTLQSVHVHDNPVTGVIANSGFVMQDSFVHNNGLEGVDLIVNHAATGTRQATIQNSIVANNGQEGIQVRGPGVSPPDTWTVQVYSSTVVGNGGPGFQINPNDDIDPQVSLKNCLVSHNAGIQLKSRNAGEVVSHNNNLFFGSSDLVRVGSSGYSSANLQDWEPGAISFDPRLVDRTSSDAAGFDIESGSPAIDSGVGLSSFSRDYFGSHRPRRAEWDIGAIETLNGDSTAPSPPSGLRLRSPSGN